jgi:phage/plasmid-associated DNA primase
MITGDMIMMPRKNTTAIQEIFTCPSMWCGNRAFGYTDCSGSIWRRFPMFPFRELIQNRDTTMQELIEENELVTIIGRCIANYHRHRLVVGKGDFWNFVPPMITQAQEELRNETDDLSKFISEGSAYYQIIKKPGACTLISDLGKAFANYMQFERKKRGVTMGTDLFAIKTAGFIVKTKFGCKVCSKPHGKLNCGSHYDRQNRKKMQWILDMEIVILKEHMQFVA